MTISRNGSRPTAKAPPEHFSGSVRVEYLFQSKPPARVGAAYASVPDRSAPRGWRFRFGEVAPK